MTPTPAPAQLRAPQPGDLGWVVSRHGSLYAAEQGWDWRFEAQVAALVARYVEQFDAAREAAWIAEWQGRPVGSVFLVQARDDADRALPGLAQLRMLLLDPAARGQGLGRRLVQSCEDFAVASGYERICLWTHSILLPARQLYAGHGYHLTHSEPHEGYGTPLVAERWEKALPRR